MQVPKLRFKEFNDEWQLKKLNEISFEVKRKTTNTNYEVLTISAKKGFVSQKERFSKIIAGGSLEKYNLLKRNEISYNKGASKSFKYGCVYIQKQYDYALVPNVYISFSFINNNPYFYEKLFENHYLDKSLRMMITSTARQDGLLNIDRKQFFNIKVPVPSLEEQTKIANFLSLIDRKIELQEKLVENLKLYKKGLLQKVFSNNHGWKSAKLGDFLIEYNKKTTINNQYDIISSTSNGLYLQKDYFDKQVASKNNIGYKILKLNQIVFSPQNLWLGNINYNNKFKIGIVSPSYKIYSINQYYNSTFISYLMTTPNAMYQYKLSSEQGASIVRRNLDLEKFLNITFKIPNIEEQNRIANLFSNLDKKIDFETNRLTKLKEYKKGLLQQMFI